MGKESKLRKSHDGSTRTSYSNGSRKLYDPDKCPDGCDEDVWSLSLYFEQLAERHGWAVEPRPILYTVLYGRIQKDNDLATVLDTDHRAVVSFHDMGEGETPYDIHAYDILVTMIGTYYLTYSSNRSPSINDFTRIDTFNNLKSFVIINKRLQYISKHSHQVVAEREPIAEARPLDKAPLTCYDGSLSADQNALDEKLEDFRREN